MTSADDDFLGRWSRRKTEARQGLRREAEPVATPEPEGVEIAEIGPEASGEAPSAVTAPAEAPQAEPEAPTEAEENATKFDGFDFESLDYASDYTQFMAEGVPEAIRRRALRKLWGSNPILANLDGLNDYDEDFTDAALAVEVLQSAYKVGRGYLTDEDIAELEANDVQKAEARAKAALAEAEIADAEQEAVETATDAADGPQGKPDDANPEPNEDAGTV